MSKLYCFVDESGQDTLGKFFAIAILVVKDNKDDLASLIINIENETGKKNVKWNKSVHIKRMAYLVKLISNKSLKGNLFYTQFEGVGYDSFTILSIAKVINKVSMIEDRKMAIYIDGLTKTKASKYSSELRKIGIKNCKVKGVKKDENNVFIRVVDGVAGFIRLALYKKDRESRVIFNKMVSSKILIEV